MDALRAEFDRFVASEGGLAAARQRRSDAATRRAIVAAARLGGSILLIVLFAGYLTRAIVAGPPVAAKAGFAAWATSSANA